MKACHMRDQTTSLSGQKVAFSLDAVAGLLEKTGILRAAQVAEILQHGRKKETALRKNLRTKDTEDP